VPKSFLLTDQVHAYLVAHATAVDDVQRDLIAETDALGGVARMQVAPEQGALLTLLTGLVGATAAVEVGTFTGYSSLCIARGLTPGGTLLCCDVSEEWTAIARRAWARAGVEDRIDLRIGPAIDTLRSLDAATTFDLGFIDADKGGYLAYYEELVPRLRPNGLLLVDNTLWGGAVVEPASADDGDDTRALRAFNDHVADDERVESVLLPVADGLTAIRKR
jgi:caffeoyl-CoA O-methyltransferase